MRVDREEPAISGKRKGTHHAKSVQNGPFILAEKRDHCNNAEESVSLHLHCGTIRMVISGHADFRRKNNSKSN